MISTLDLFNLKPIFDINNRLGLEKNIIRGWIFIPEWPQKQLVIEIYINNKKISEFKNDQYREDVKERMKHPSGICGFNIDLRNCNTKEKLNFENIDLKIKNSNFYIKKCLEKELISIKKIYKKFNTNSNEKWVIENANFSIYRNDVIGIIGRNGQGKSTLLSLLAGLDEPDKGEITRNASISWPIGKAGGFQGSLTGRENCKFVCKLYFGNSKNKIKKTISQIESFADIGEYFDMPIKTYSSGMNSRVSFALSLCIEFDVYLVDEVTAVGDLNFRAKCQEAFQKISKQKTLIMVSHNLDEIIKNCNRLVLLNNGKLNLYDDVKKGINFYKQNLN